MYICTSRIYLIYELCELIKKIPNKHLLIWIVQKPVDQHEWRQILQTDYFHLAMKHNIWEIHQLVSTVFICMRGIWLKEPYTYKLDR